MEIALVTRQAQSERTNNSQLWFDSLSPASVSVGDSGLPWLPKDGEYTVVPTHCETDTSFT